MVVCKGKGGISATVLAYSRSTETDDEILTYEIECPRFIWAEVLTHKALSRNCASSRAIPFAKMLNNLTAIPVHWGRNKSGMQATEELSDVEIEGAENQWNVAKTSASHFAQLFNTLGIHKQITNRLIEPFQMVKAVITATEWDNFFWLRNHEAAQPEIHELARVMLEAKKASVPVALSPGDWHVPYYEDGYWIGNELGYDIKGYTLMEARIISAARCAAVSYRNTDYPLDKCIEVYERLIGDDRKHASAFEHQATPMDYNTELDFTEWVVNLDEDPRTWEKGITHADRNGNLWSGNFKGFIQHRQLIDGHVCTNYEEKE